MCKLVQGAVHGFVELDETAMSHFRAKETKSSTGYAKDASPSHTSSKAVHGARYRADRQTKDTGTENQRRG